MSLSASNIYTAPNELPNKAPSTTTTWADDLCPPSQRSSRSGEADTFVAVRRFGRADGLHPEHQRSLCDALNDAYMSGIAALAGSAIGALASFKTTWLTQHAQERAQRFAQAMALRRRLYGEFIEEASKLFTDALTHQLDDPSKFVHLYALVGELRLFATANVILRAEEVMRLIVETYHLPNRDFRNPQERQEHDVDVLRAFSEACREELHV